jgi:hypothetical protein
MLCAYLAGALLIGLLGNAVAGAWWLDPAVGLLIAALAVREGWSHGAARDAAFRPASRPDESAKTAHVVSTVVDRLNPRSPQSAVPITYGLEAI